MTRGSNFRFAGCAIDLGCIAAALSMAGIWQHPGRDYPVWTTATIRLAIYWSTWILVSQRLDTYLVAASRSLGKSLRSVVETWAVTWGIAGLIDVKMLESVGTWKTLVGGLLLLTVVRVLWLKLPVAALQGWRARVLVIGTCDSARSLTVGSDARSKMNVIGFVPFPGETTDGLPHLRQLGQLDDLQQVVTGQNVDFALVCPSDQAVTGDVRSNFLSRLDAPSVYYPRTGSERR